MIQLGISAFFHDSAACIVKDGKVLAAAEEERFTEIKHDESFPINAIQWALSYCRLSIDDIDEVCWYEDPTIKRNRVVKTFNKYFFKTLKYRRQYLKKFNTDYSPEHNLKKIGYNGPIKYTEHHLSHAAFSYYTSNFKESAILTVDGVGEWETVTICKGEGDKIEKLLSINFPHSLGLLYSAFTAYLGFKPNEGEYKVMGLAPYGDPNVFLYKLRKLFSHNKKGIFKLNMKYFSWEYSDHIMFTKHLFKLLGVLPRLPEEPLTQEHKDLAAGLQKIYEEEFLNLTLLAKKLTNSENLCLGGGCAYNGVANNKAYRFFKHIHIPFAPSDAGSAIGTCLFQNRKTSYLNTSPYLGPSYSNSYIKDLLKSKNLKYTRMEDNFLVRKVAEFIKSGNIVAWFQGRMEFGARALGNRSILATPRDPEMREKLNYVIKKREGFRPFAPSVIKEDQNRWFICKEDIPYMNQVVFIKGFNRREVPVYLPSATHVDYTARVHTVTEDQNPLYYKLIEELKRTTGYGVVLNTSFNLKDQTITMTPEQAIQRFLDSDIDYLILNNFIIHK